MVTLEKKYFIGMRALKFCMLNSCKPSQIPNIYGFIVIKISYCGADECRTQFSCLPVCVVVICFLSLLVALLWVFPTLVTQNCTLRAMVSALAFPGAVRRP